MERIILTWTAATGTIAIYFIYRGVNGAERTLLTQVSGDVLTYTDYDVDGEANTYDYHVVARATNGLDGPESNVISLP